MSKWTETDKTEKKVIGSNPGHDSDLVAQKAPPRHFKLNQLLSLHCVHRVRVVRVVVVRVRDCMLGPIRRSFWLHVTASSVNLWSLRKVRPRLAGQVETATPQMDILLQADGP